MTTANERELSGFSSVKSEMVSSCIVFKLKDYLNWLPFLINYATPFTCSLLPKVWGLFSIDLNSLCATINAKNCSTTSWI